MRIRSVTASRLAVPLVDPFVIATGRVEATRSVLVRVRDTGPGFAPEVAPRATEAFFTTRNTGVGLGLTIARDVVRAHGGDIWLEDSPLGGLRARIKLPV